MNQSNWVLGRVRGGEGVDRPDFSEGDRRWQGPGGWGGRATQGAPIDVLEGVDRGLERTRRRGAVTAGEDAHRRGCSGERLAVRNGG